jgi:LacI family transcriptional regulator
MKSKATLKNISEKLQISISTVSRALKDHPDIAQSTKQKVRELAEILDYEPNAFAVYLRTNNSKVLGLIVPEISNYFYHSFIAAVEEEARKKGYTLIIFQSGNDPATEQANLKLCKLNRVAGILIALSSPGADLSAFRRLEESGIPILFFDKVPEEAGFLKVCLDDENAGELAAEAVLVKKRKKILGVFGNPELYITKKRIRSFTRSLDEKSPGTPLTVIYANTHQEAFSKTLAILEGPEKTDAIFCMSDEILTGVIRAIQKNKLRIPEDLGLITVSNGFFPTLFEPEITYIETSGYKLGKMAMDTLLAALSGNEVAQEGYLPAKLVKGNSL